MSLFACSSDCLQYLTVYYDREGWLWSLLFVLSAGIGSNLIKSTVRNERNVWSLTPCLLLREGWVFTSYAFYLLVHLCFYAGSINEVRDTDQKQTCRRIRLDARLGTTLLDWLLWLCMTNLIWKIFFMSTFQTSKPIRSSRIRKSKLHG